MFVGKVWEPFGKENMSFHSQIHMVPLFYFAFIINLCYSKAIHTVFLTPCGITILC